MGASAARMRGSVSSLALLPLRLFLGATFVYAGMDKFLDPAFLHDSGAGSIGAQLQGFTHVSPIAPLVVLFAQPWPVVIGGLIALAEIAIGLATLTGWLFRTGAAGGFGLSVLFWLTASWATTPYYYGPDLPYALGWLTLTLAGHGDRFVVPFPALADDSAPYRRARRPGYDRVRAGVRTWDGSSADDGQPDIDRRLVLQAAVLGAIAVVAGGLATFGPWRRSEATLADTGSESTGALGEPVASPGSPAAASAAGSAQGSLAGPKLASLSQLPTGRAVRFNDPETGDPAILVHLENDQVVAFDAICTHAGCVVGFDRSSQLLVCPCHGAVFDPAHQAAVLGGPTRQPLASLPVAVDQASGTIYRRL